MLLRTDLGFDPINKVCCSVEDQINEILQISNFRRGKHCVRMMRARNNFTNVLQAALIMCADPKSAKIQSSCQSFVLLDMN